MNVKRLRKTSSFIAYAVAADVIDKKTLPLRKPSQKPLRPRFSKKIGKNEHGRKITGNCYSAGPLYGRIIASVVPSNHLDGV